MQPGRNSTFRIERQCAQLRFAFIQLPLQFDAQTLAHEIRAKITGLCKALDFAWDRALDAKLPLSRYTMTQPDANKWRRHEQEIARVRPSLQPILERVIPLIRRMAAARTRPVSANAGSRTPVSPSDKIPAQRAAAATRRVLHACILRQH